MPLRRRPKSSVSCAKRDSFDCFDGFSIAVAHHGAELAERFGRHRRQQRLAIGKMLVGRRLRDAELLGKRADADRFGAAELDFVQRGLNQGIAEIPMVIGVQRFACGSRWHSIS